MLHVTFGLMIFSHRQESIKVGHIVKNKVIFTSNPPNLAWLSTSFTLSRISSIFFLGWESEMASIFRVLWCVPRELRQRGSSCCDTQQNIKLMNNCLQS